MKKGLFNLRNYVTNSEKLQAKIDQVEKPSDNVCKEKAVLGLRRNTETDELIFTVPGIETSKLAQACPNNIIKFISNKYIHYTCTFSVCQMCM
jgi:hypothetical protein